MDLIQLQLIEAIQKSKVDVVKSLLENGANPNFISSCGKSALSVAATLGNIPMMQLLVSHEDWGQDSEKKQIANTEESSATHKENLGYFVYVYEDETNISRNESLDVGTPEGMESLEWDVECDVEWNDANEVEDEWADQFRWYASILDRTGGLTQELDRVCDLNLQDMRGRTAVHYATEHSQLAALNFLVAAGCKVDIGDKDGVTPLHLAASRDCCETVELLLARGANVNCRTASDKMAPIHFAAGRGYTSIVWMLLKFGAAVDPLDSSDRTPLMYALNKCQIETVKLLLSHGAKVNIEEIHGYSPLYEAVRQKSVEMAKLLIDEGAKLTQSPHLLHQSVLCRHTDMVELLLRSGAYHSLRDDKGNTPLLMAISIGHLPIISLLLQYGANPNYSNHVTQCLPLHRLLFRWNKSEDMMKQIMQLLCQYDVNLDPIVHGSTPLIQAVNNKLWLGAERLLQVGAHANPPIPEYLVGILETAISHYPDSKMVPYLLVAAGYNMSHYVCDYPTDWAAVNTTTIRGYMTYRKFNPPNLKELCRIKLRQTMKHKAQFIIPNMEIPQTLKQFLLYRDIK